MILSPDYAYLFRSRYALDAPLGALRGASPSTCEHCGVNYQARPVQCLNCGSRHLRSGR